MIRQQLTHECCSIVRVIVKVSTVHERGSGGRPAGGSGQGNEQLDEGNNYGSYLLPFSFFDRCHESSRLFNRLPFCHSLRLM